MPAESVVVDADGVGVPAVGVLLGAPVGHAVNAVVVEDELPWQELLHEGRPPKQEPDPDLLDSDGVVVQLDHVDVDVHQGEGSSVGCRRVHPAPGQTRISDSSG